MNPELIAPRVDSRRAKLAGRAAEQILADVIELGWPVGQVLGSESELIERYGVSRAVLREAIRLVEHQRVARMRRGSGGGLVIDEPDIDAVIGPAVIYLLRVGATLDEVFDARIVLEELVTEIASRTLGADDIAILHRTLEQEAAGNISNYRLLHARLAKLSANPVLELFVEMLSRVSNFHFNDSAALPEAFDRDVCHAHAGIVEAIVMNNPDLAQKRMNRHLTAEVDFIRRQPATVQRLDPATALLGSGNDKRGEALARVIFTEVVNTGATPGEFLGSEAALMDKYEVSRAVFREAVRILEYQQVALTRRGPNGGLFVTAPDISALTDVITIYLRRHGVKPRHIAELRTGLELAVTERAAANLRTDRSRAKLIDEALAAESEQGMALAFDHSQDFHSTLAKLADNRALQLIHRVATRLGWQFFSEYAFDNRRVGALSEALSSTVGPVHRGIAEALLAGDTELAMTKMRSHMSATSPEVG